MQKSLEGKSTQALSSKTQSLSQEKAETSENLSKVVALQLMSLMEKVVKDNVSPPTVNAACNCAEQINKILKLNVEMKRLGL